MIAAGKAVPVRWDTPVVLNQGETSRCVGYSFATLCASSNVTAPGDPTVTDALADAIYFRAKEIEGEPGGEDGTTLREGAKAAKALGLLDAYAFADYASATDWVRKHGPVVIGIPWTLDMFTPAKGVVRPTGEVKGGHAICWTADAMQPADNGLVNSWGREWGVDGRCYLSDTDLYQLLQSGEVCMAVKLVKRPAPPWFDRLRAIRKRFFGGSK